MKKSCALMLITLSLLFLLGACANTVSTSELASSTSNSSEYLASHSQNSSSPSNSEDSSMVAGDSVFDKDGFTKYFMEFANYFPNEAETPEDLVSEGRMSFYLLRTSYLEAEAGNLPPLETNKDSFYLIPDESMKAVARKYLGISDLDLTKIQEWAMGADPSTGEKQYSLDSGPPSSMTSIQDIEVSANNIVVRADVNGTWSEKEGGGKELVYTFLRLVDENDSEYYQLVSIMCQK